MRNERASSRDDRFLRSFRIVCFGTAVGAIVCALLLLLVSFLLVSLKKIPQGAMAPISIVIAAVSAFVAGYTTGKISKIKGFLYGLASGLTLFAIIFLAGLIVAAEPISVLTFVKFGVMFLLGTIGGMVGVNKKKRIK